MEFDLPCGHEAIARVVRQAGLSRKRRTKRQKRNDLRAVKARLKAFETVQMDVKYLDDIAHYLPQMRTRSLPRFQCTIRDVRTGLLFLAFGDHLSKTHATSAVGRFLAHLRAHGVKPPGVRIQTDNGGEFDGQTIRPTDRDFTHTIEQLGARRRFIPPDCSNANADVESSHALIETEFYDLERFAGRKELLAKAFSYQAHFNLTRKNSYQRWRTPLERLREAAPQIDPHATLPRPVILDTLLLRTAGRRPRAPHRAETLVNLITGRSLELTTPVQCRTPPAGQHQPGHPVP